MQRLSSSDRWTAVVVTELVAARLWDESTADAAHQLQQHPEPLLYHHHHHHYHHHLIIIISRNVNIAVVQAVLQNHVKAQQRLLTAKKINHQKNIHSRLHHFSDVTIVFFPSRFF